MHYKNNFNILGTISISFFILICLSINPVLAASSDFEYGLSKIREDLNHQLGGINTNSQEDIYNECKKPILEMASADIFNFVGEAQARVVIGSMFEPILIFIKLNPAIESVFTIYEYYELLTSAGSWEDFKQDLKEAIIEKIKEKAIGKIKGKVLKNLDPDDVETLELIEEIAGSMEEFWGKNNGGKIAIEEPFETFEYTAPVSSKFPGCEREMTGKWFRRTGDVVISIVGDCKCKYYNTGKFSLWVFGRIDYNLNENNQTIESGSYIKSELVTDCPCSGKKTAEIPKKGEYVAYFNENLEKVNKGLEDLPLNAINQLKGHDFLIIQIAMLDGSKEEFFAKIDNIEGIAQLTSFSEGITDKKPKLSVKTDESTIKEILLAENQVNTFRDKFNSGKFDIKSDKLTTNILLTGTQMVSKVYSALTYITIYRINKNGHKEIIFQGEPAELSRSASDVLTLTLPGYTDKYAINNYGNVLGYTTNNINQFVNYNSQRYSPGGGIYNTKPTVIKKQYYNIYNIKDTSYSPSTAFSTGMFTGTGLLNYRNI